MAPTTRSQVLRQAVAENNSAATTSAAVLNTQQSTAPINKAKKSNISADFLTNDTRYRPPRASAPDEPPRFTIDLSLPPEQRYLEVAAAFRAEMRGLTALFDEVVADIARVVPMRLLKSVCWLALRGLRESEETRELRGISCATGVPMYLLVCFNVLLDLFMGCSSGGAAVRDDDEALAAAASGGSAGSKMLHFRTLDWGMPSLRRVLVQLDFKHARDGPVVASSITYAGFVGVLTGVRKGFSVSLNFRPQRNNKGRLGADVRYYWHLAMVLLGRRRSIASDLRRMLLPRRSRHNKRTTGEPQFWSYEEVVPPSSSADGRVKICGRHLTTTACYLCFSNGSETTVLEKDRVTALVRRSSDFIVVTNNDVDAHDDVSPGHGATLAVKAQESPYAAALQEIVHEAKDRKQCAEHNYHNTRVTKALQRGIVGDETQALQRVMDIDDIVQLVQKYPTTNESTHFACVMDPKLGSVRWCRRWMKPITAKWIREHQSETW